MAARDRLLPLVVACPLFLQNVDTSAIATALPAIAQSLQVQPLHLNLAITSYLLSLAVFLPLSGWCASRFGARRVFCAAIAFFALGSALCGLATSLPWLVAFRVLQGFGGAMMVPVGRLILLRSVPAAGMVAAMVWFTVPPTVGRMIGPLVGGAIVTWTSWRWIFLLNIPFGLVGILLAWRLISPEVDEELREPFDAPGFLLLALGLTGLLGALEMTGKGLVGAPAIGAAAAVGTVAMLLYVRRSARMAAPMVNLGVLRFRTYFTSIVGGSPVRIAIGATPFLLPLMFQLGFGLSPLDSGLLTVATALGSLATRGVMGHAIRRFGFRPLLIAATAVSGTVYMSYGLFTPATPHALMFCTMLLGGLVTSMAMVSLQTLGFSEIPKPLLSHATTLSTMTQQVTLTFGVVLGAALVNATAVMHGGSSAHLTAQDFPPAFFVVGLTTLLSLFFFARLAPEHGEDMR
ncbi:MFS transporter [Caenimonas terrae]|uniref:MFS transporter n=1 Tax=Caenimonas terrae TaxID=696074 RepID=A0ABW0N860_9BURK